MTTTRTAAAKPDLLGELRRRCVLTVAGCWEWQGSRTSAGYGQFIRRGKKLYIHRASYEAANGPIPDGLVIDHLCRNRACCNPEHLEPVTRRENNRRGEHPLAVLGRTDTCKRGHDLNTTGRPNGAGRRTCDVCRRERLRRSA